MQLCRSYVGAPARKVPLGCAYEYMRNEYIRSLGRNDGSSMHLQYLFDKLVFPPSVSALPFATTPHTVSRLAAHSLSM